MEPRRGGADERGRKREEEEEEVEEEASPSVVAVGVDLLPVVVAASCPALSRGSCPLAEGVEDKRRATRNKIRQREERGRRARGITARGEEVGSESIFWRREWASRSSSAEEARKKETNERVAAFIISVELLQSSFVSCLSLRVENNTHFLSSAPARALCSSRNAREREINRDSSRSFD